MRVLLLDQFSDPGGAQQCLLELVPAMRDRGWESMVGLPGNGALVGHLNAMEVPVARLTCGPYQAGRKTAFDAARFLLDTPRLASQIAKLTVEFRPDLLYVNGPRLLPAVALANPQAPVVFHSHSYLPSRSVRRLAGASLRRTKASLIACCQYVAQPWRIFTPNVTVIYNGVAGPVGGGIPRQVKRGPVVGCIGRLAPEKGQMEFLRTAARIQREMADCRFLIFGATLFATADSERYESELRTVAAGMPVEFRGWVENVYEALSELDLLLVPSTLYEATTRVILEAFSAGVPVIARRAGGIPEVIEHGQNGLLAESEEEIARLSIELLRDPGRMAKISEQGCQTWSERFTLARYRRQILDALVNRVEQ